MATNPQRNSMIATVKAIRAKLYHGPQLNRTRTVEEMAAQIAHIGEAAIDPLIGELQKTNLPMTGDESDATSQAQEIALAALGQIGNRRAVPAIITYVDRLVSEIQSEPVYDTDTDGYCRKCVNPYCVEIMWAMDALGRIGDPAAADYIATKLFRFLRPRHQHCYSMAEDAAQRALRRMGPDGTRRVDELVRMLEKGRSGCFIRRLFGAIGIG